MATHLTEQNDRKARKMVADGVRPRTAHDIFFKKTADLGLDIGEYNKYRRQYSRWRGAYLPNCVPERFASDFRYLYPNLQLRMIAEAEALQLV
uniref:Integrase n=1 Tax=Panagrolaimus superbus TaxID=310955 RepID=A0A914Y233_9BILA